MYQNTHYIQKIIKNCQTKTGWC